MKLGIWEAEGNKVFPVYVPEGAAKDCRICTVSTAKGIDAETNAKAIALTPSLANTVEAADYLFKQADEARADGDYALAEARTQKAIDRISLMARVLNAGSPQHDLG